MRRDEMREEHCVALVVASSLRRRLGVSFAFSYLASHRGYVYIK